MVRRKGQHGTDMLRLIWTAYDGVNIYTTAYISWVRRANRLPRIDIHGPQVSARVRRGTPAVEEMDDEDEDEGNRLFSLCR
jgi:hypothetical protein